MSQAERYFHLCALREQRNPDAYYQAAFYLLSSNEAVYNRAKRFVDNDGINFTAIKNNMKSMATTEKQIIRIAENLFRADGPCMVTPADLAQLGQPLLDEVVNAIYILAGQAAVQVTQQKNGLLDLEIDLSKYHQIKGWMEQIDNIADSGLLDEYDGDKEVG